MRPPEKIVDYSRLLPQFMALTPHPSSQAISVASLSSVIVIDSLLFRFRI
jgi:hypothetical protein